MFTIWFNISLQAVKFIIQMIISYGGGNKYMYME